MLPQETIRRKRDGEVLERAEIEAFVAGLVAERIGAEQAAALAMAIYFQSLNAAETGALTRAMAASGRIIDWSALALGGPIVDKHSTGGVGDKVSLVLAPMVAACGAYVPMISGRGLGHGGGTLDKLESIPGYDTAPDLERFQRIVQAAGCAIIGQTPDLAPADKRLYAIRDITATVESIPLITASILSKKMAAGLEALVMDVKTGNGAFMQTLADARALAEAIRGAAAESGLPTRAVISDMSQVLGDSAGNAVEVAESIAYLTGERREPRLHEVVMTLAGHMLVMGGLAADTEGAQALAAAKLADGGAAAVFGEMVHALGGPADLLERPARHLPAAPVQEPVPPPRPGYLAQVNTRAVGHAIIELGGGRTRAEAGIDHAVGLTEVAPVGAWVDGERPLAVVHARTEAAAEAAIAQLAGAVDVREQAPAPQPVIHHG